MPSREVGLVLFGTLVMSIGTQTVLAQKKGTEGLSANPSMLQSLEERETARRAAMCAEGLIPKLACEGAERSGTEKPQMGLGNHPVSGQPFSQWLVLACGEGLVPLTFCGDEPATLGSEEQQAAELRANCEVGLLAAIHCSQLDKDVRTSGAEPADPASASGDAESAAAGSEADGTGLLGSLGSSPEPGNRTNEASHLWPSRSSG